jgi:hypothetical protein
MLIPLLPRLYWLHRLENHDRKEAKKAGERPWKTGSEPSLPLRQAEGEQELVPVLDPDADEHVSQLRPAGYNVHHLLVGEFVLTSVKGPHETSSDQVRATPLSVMRDVQHHLVGSQDHFGRQVEGDLVAEDPD